ncbi:MAG: hypothetical protein JKY33_09230 [Bacteroidia bacterium]|nr:hypothetical protein [Bacteroidia bacterium]
MKEKKFGLEGHNFEIQHSMFDIGYLMKVTMISSRNMLEMYNIPFCYIEEVLDCIIVKTEARS